MIKVLIADDQELIRESLKIILSAYPDIEVVGAVGDGTEVLEILTQTRPDIILMDIRMPKMDGVLCTKRVKEEYPKTKIIILTTFDDDDFIFSALKHGHRAIYSREHRWKIYTMPSSRLMRGGPCSILILPLRSSSSFHKWLNPTMLFKLMSKIPMTS